ncbi:MAG: S-adenosylmethionine:tRNA ribosyltransferase-isomerase [Bacteroidales bacterium]|nr:S-adenosylmethionine:tRNA ribosyltransferase-isomerase [Bacteroidales bacterium]
MIEPQQIRIDDYDYPLPEDRIAKFPLERRDQSKLLVCKEDGLQESTFAHVAEFLPQDALLVFNNTKVIHARLFFRKPTGSTIEIFCLEPWNQPVATAFEEREHCVWTCFVGNNKKWKDSTLSRTFTLNDTEVTLVATRREAVTNTWIVDFSWNGGFSFAEIIECAGVIPLPPYLNREAEASDKERYQTVYALHEGSVAAPTAGLHFTPEVFDTLKAKGIGTEFVTLHVGAGTFKPVNTPTIGEHEMHVEKVQLSAANLQRIISHKGPVIPVGTTSVRTLESVYWFGVKLSQNPDLEAMHVMQWDPYQLESSAISKEEALSNVLDWMQGRGEQLLDGDTQLLIAPGYKYHVISGIITNFHQPKSTLLLLVSALVGEKWKECYRYALDHQFRFLSYGDSCLFLK